MQAIHFCPSQVPSHGTRPKAYQEAVFMLKSLPNLKSGRDISMASHFHGQKFRGFISSSVLDFLTNQPRPGWYKERPFSLSKESQESDGKHHHGRSSQINRNKYISDYMWEKLLLPSASLRVLTHTGKAFWSDLFMGSKFLCQHGMKKSRWRWAWSVDLRGIFSVEMNF